MMTGTQSALAAENAVSAFEINVDGVFDTANNEYSDITPDAYISPDDDTGTLFSTTLDDPNANSFVYAAIAGTGGEADIDELYLLYDYLPRTENFDEGDPGEFVADITFPITIVLAADSGPDLEISSLIPESMQAFAGCEGPCGGEEVVIPITVQIRVPELGEPICSSDGDSFLDVFVVSVDPADDLGLLNDCASDLGMGAAVGFGPTPNAAFDHMIIELEVPLLISEEFASDPDSPFPSEGFPDGIYSPLPQFWGGSAANDLVDPPFAAALFTILPDGTVVTTNLAATIDGIGGEIMSIHNTSLILAGINNGFSALGVLIAIATVGFGGLFYAIKRRN